MSAESNISSSLVKVTDFTQQINIVDSLNSIIEYRMKFENISNKCLQFNYRIPYHANHNLNSIEIEYGQTEKKTIFYNPKCQNIIKYDDDVARNNFTICINQISDYESVLEISNFQPSKNIIVSIFIMPYFIEDGIIRYLEIPRLEICDKFLYPDYSAKINVHSKDININEIELEYNQEKHSSDIDNKTEIKINSVSFQHPFLLKMPLKNVNPKYTNFLAKPKNLFFFIDVSIASDPMIISQIKDFLSNLGSDFRIDIIKYGNSRNLFRDSMVNVDQDIIKEIGEFLKYDSSPSNKSFIDSTYGFVDAYTDIFVPGSQQQKIKEIDVNNTIAVCLGSISDKRMIASRKVPTFVIDTNRKHNTRIFAQNSGFIYLETTSSGGSELIQCLKQILKRESHQVIVKSYHSFEEDFEDLRELIKKVELILEDKSKSNNSKTVLRNMNLQKILKKYKVPAKLLEKPMVKRIMETSKTPESFFYQLKEIYDIYENSREQQHVAFEEDNSTASDVFVSPVLIKSSIINEENRTSSFITLPAFVENCTHYHNFDSKNKQKSTKVDSTDSQETTTINDQNASNDFKKTPSQEDQEKEALLQQQEVQQQIKMECVKNSKESLKDDLKKNSDSNILLQNSDPNTLQRSTLQRKMDSYNSDVNSRSFNSIYY